MANSKNETGKPSGAQSGTTGNVSAGTSVGNIGEPPMPHAHEQRSAQGSGATGGNQASGQQKGQSQQNAQEQGGSITDKAQQAADQARQKAGEAYEGASDWARDTYERASHWASDTYSGQRRRMNQMGGRSARAFGNARGGVQSYVSENPMVVGLVGLATGLLLGALLPRTRRENEMFGEWADEVRNQGLRYARDAANRGREYVEDTFSGDEARFSRHESEFNNQRDTNRH
ncbi:hypothetical protein [Microvirga lotononidis]|uniref:Uncharacterized protein n=1 Tax=Microvirga lotononidis TaxID=864069 RepID=I4YUR9_9HYPH|nr:hypothetical protein [Microvirga lotononidis]EIM27711.1 hypothetical protein MicloDRAFT_00042840 [Microvirga lotononidis]WQO28151.1 hypothetical protein U0023_03335 [Microvirga lotononidis]